MIEECAVALLLKDYITYPGELNAAIRYAAKKHNKELKHIVYRVKNRGKEDVISNNIILNYFPQGYSPSFFGAMVAYQADSLNLTPSNQVFFSAQFFKLCSQFMNDKDGPREEKQLDEKNVTHSNSSNNIVSFDRTG